VTAGLIVLILALAAALAGGFLWQSRNGRMRSVGGTQAGGRAVGGRATSHAPSDSVTAGLTDSASAPLRLTTGQLGHALGERATLVEFSSAFCAPCRATRRILTDVAGMTPGVAFVEIDAESRLDLVRHLGVLRTPTVLVTDADGTIVMRGSGLPRKADVFAALGRAVEGVSQVSSIIGRQ
jgi:thiol-disulfide isomerase/thioredoxin